MPYYPPASGTGDFSGPSSSTDNAVVRFDGTGGKTGQDSTFIIADDGNVTATILDAVTNANSTVLTLAHETSGTAANSFGLFISMLLESSTTAGRNAAGITAKWLDATDATRKGILEFLVYSGASGSALFSMAGDNKMAFFGGTRVAQQTGSISTGLSNLGLVTSGLYDIPYLCYEDQKTSGTTGGTFTSGADRTRTLNTEVADTHGIGSVASNQVSIPAGTYIFRGQATAYAVDAHQIFLYNATDSSEVKRGDSGYATSAYQNEQKVVVAGLVTISGTKAFELRHRCQTTSTTFGFGNAASFGTECYARLEFWKVG